jgi:hypothetical protein
MSWRSFLILHESTITLLESLSFAVFIGRVESQCTSVNDLSLLQGEVSRDILFFLLCCT